jgi:hypothetical protein
MVEWCQADPLLKLACTAAHHLLRHMPVTTPQNPVSVPWQLPHRLNLGLEQDVRLPLAPPHQQVRQLRTCISQQALQALQQLLLQVAQGLASCQGLGATLLLLSWRLG